MKKYLLSSLCMILILAMLSGFAGCTVTVPEESEPEQSAVPDESQTVSETESGDESRELSAEESKDVSKEDSSAVSEDESKEEPVSESSEDSQPEPVVRDWPYSTGTFIQLWAFTNYTQAKWEQHIKYLQEVGFEFMIVQMICDTTMGKITSAYYPCTLTEYKAPGYYTVNQMDPLVEACKKTGMKLFLGLENPKEWFESTREDPEWRKKQGEVGVAVAGDLYKRYVQPNPGLVLGWYFVEEYWGGMKQVDLEIDLLNRYRDGLTELDPSMPMMLSPFLSRQTSAADTAEEWKQVFAGVHFREGDIFCCQDSVGAGGISLNHLDEYFKALKEAVDTKPGLLFWANNEDFTSGGGTASMGRFVTQMKISEPYVSGFVTFAYSHYFAPDQGKQKEHELYKKYYLTGEYEEDASEIAHDPVDVSNMKLVSLGCSYSGAPNTRGDGFDDDGTRLTDGVIPSADGNTLAYFGSTNANPSIILDLGSVVSNLSVFRMYSTHGAWGIGPVASFEYAVSEDGVNWTEIGKVAGNGIPVVDTNENGWEQFCGEVVATEPVSGRYVRCKIGTSGHLWLGEFCVYAEK